MLVNLNLDVLQRLLEKKECICLLVIDICILFCLLINFTIIVLLLFVILELGKPFLEVESS